MAIDHNFDKTPWEELAKLAGKHIDKLANSCYNYDVSVDVSAGAIVYRPLIYLFLNADA